jgi:citrate synthase
VAEATGRLPNVDFALAALARAYALPREAPLRLFTLARSVGWAAHALEQIGEGHLIRPRATYVGPLTSAPATGKAQSEKVTRDWPE